MECLFAGPRTTDMGAGISAGDQRGGELDEPLVVIDKK